MTDINASLPKCLLVSTRVVEETSYIEKRNALAYEYVSYFEALGYTLILVPSNSSNAERYLSMAYDGVVLTGGNTVSLNDDSDDEAAGVYPERDEVEKILLEGAIEAGKPVLGICRGMQFINVNLGGTAKHGISGHVAINHSVSSDNQLLDGKSTNSYHGDGVPLSNVAPELQVLAQADDSMAEAIYHPERPILGLQWHPERQDCDFDRELILKFFKTGKIQ